MNKTYWHWFKVDCNDHIKTQMLLTTCENHLRAYCNKNPLYQVIDTVIKSDMLGIKMFYDGDGGSNHDIGRRIQEQVLDPIAKEFACEKTVVLIYTQPNNIKLAKVL